MSAENETTVIIDHLLQESLADDGHRNVSAMRIAAVLEEKDSLPGAELHLSIRDRNSFARARESHTNV